MDNACIVVSTDELFAKDDLPVRSLLRAIVRHRHYKGWDYEEADDDFSKDCQLHRPLATAIDKLASRKLSKVKKNPVSTLSQSLLLGARLLNIEKSHAKEDASLVDAMFAEPYN